VSGTEERVKVVADEILRGQILALDEALCFPGIAIIPITNQREQTESNLHLHIPRSTLKDNVLNAIVGSIPLNTCGVMILDSLGDVITFKLYREIYAFWARIKSIEKIVEENYRSTRKPLSKNGAMARATAFLIRLRNDGSEGVMRDKRDFFAVSLTEASTTAVSIEDYLESTAAILYTASCR
jgi:hypothetical protein